MGYAGIGAESCGVSGREITWVFIKKTADSLARQSAAFFPSLVPGVVEIRVLRQGDVESLYP